MSNNAVTRITISAERDDPLESVRKAVQLADDMVAIGGKVKVTGDLFLEVRFDVVPDAEAEAVRAMSRNPAATVPPRQDGAFSEVNRP